jgi:hypothetical protein
MRSTPWGSLAVRPPYRRVRGAVGASERGGIERIVQRCAAGPRVSRARLGDYGHQREAAVTSCACHFVGGRFGSRPRRRLRARTRCGLGRARRWQRQLVRALVAIWPKPWSLLLQRRSLFIRRSGATRNPTPLFDLRPGHGGRHQPVLTSTSGAAVGEFAPGNNVIDPRSVQFVPLDEGWANSGQTDAVGGWSWRARYPTWMPARCCTVRSPSGLPGQCRATASGPAARVTERSASATTIASST